MTLMQINWKPTSRQLWQFGQVCAVGLPAIGWLWGGSPTMIVTLAAIGAILAACGWLVPAALKPVFLGLSLVTAPIGIVVGEVAMLVIYFGVFVPLGFVFRAMQGDPLELRLDRARDSYWQPKKKPLHVANYYRQS